MLSLNLCFAHEVLGTMVLEPLFQADTPHAAFREQISCYLSTLLLPGTQVPTWPPPYCFCPVTNASPHFLAPSGLLSLFFLVFVQQQLVLCSQQDPLHSYSLEQNRAVAMCVRWSGSWWDQEAWQPVGPVLSWSKVLGVCSHPAGNPVPKGHDILFF